jgi:hypothetical protein
LEFNVAATVILDRAWSHTGPGLILGLVWPTMLVRIKTIKYRTMLEEK